MRILMITNTLKKGGKERRMLELIKGLLKADEYCRIMLISLDDIVDYPQVYEMPIRFETIVKGKSKDWKLAFKLRSAIRDFNPDIIHSWDITASAYLQIANIFSRKPVVHGVIYDAAADSDVFRKHYRRIKMLTPFSKMFVANSKAGLSAYGTPASKSVCIYNGIDLERFNGLPAVDETITQLWPGKKENRFVIMMVAAFEIRKDHGTLLKAAIELINEDPGYHVIFIGEGEFRPAVMEQVPGHLINKQLLFTGMRHDIEALLQCADVGVLTTNAGNHGEGLSNAIIEYMASGLPVIATKGGGTDELVREEETGLLIAPGDAKGLAAAIRKLKNDPPLARQLGANGAAWVRSELNLERVTQSYLQLYRHQLGEKIPLPTN
ncbi:glycosyltransferase family 4 protein [Nostoc ellipsosporum NOK]|nr:glycosyltransferase family 4 protein [Nostoc ellipsosporum NOK]